MSFKEWRKFFTADEVVVHNELSDAWYILNSKILNLSKLFIINEIQLTAGLKTLLAYAGKDISSFFNPINGTPKTWLSQFGTEIPTLPGVFDGPSCNGVSEFYWWQDPKYVIGHLTRRERWIKIVNTLTRDEVRMKVCEEDTIFDIQRKYAEKYNSHAGSYTWRQRLKGGLNKRLIFNRTLTENGILWHNYDYEFPPQLWLYFNDDFTIA